MGFFFLQKLGVKKSFSFLNLHFWLGHHLNGLLDWLTPPYSSVLTSKMRGMRCLSWFDEYLPAPNHNPLYPTK
jgi:hypothetical protein